MSHSKLVPLLKPTKQININAQNYRQDILVEKHSMTIDITFISKQINTNAQNYHHDILIKKTFHHNQS